MIRLRNRNWFHVIPYGILKPVSGPGVSGKAFESDLIQSFKYVSAEVPWTCFPLRQIPQAAITSRPSEGLALRLILILINGAIFQCLISCGTSSIKSQFCRIIAHARRRWILRNISISFVCSEVRLPE
ncbi:hypothetical protein RJ641_036614 [Dillenia turbinata]|uniref:Uncharacterized protein n=1 Tax=Dillenia turbinata TaxID=194707 RepID=A0AAN8ZGM7_9MAGN